jgi:hypothetical protein
VAPCVEPVAPDMLLPSNFHWKVAMLPEFAVEVDEDRLSVVPVHMLAVPVMVAVGLFLSVKVNADDKLLHPLLLMIYRV